MKKPFIVLMLMIPYLGCSQLPNLQDLLTPSNIQKLGEIGAKEQAEAAAIYAAYGMEPYVPSEIDPTYNFSIAKEKLAHYMEKWVFRLYGPAYKEYSDEFTYRNEQTKQYFKGIKNIVVTDEFLQFTNNKPTNSGDTATIYFKDILARKVEYFTPWRNGVSAYTRVGDHFFRCSIRELPDILYYIQQYYASQYYPNELKSFQKTVNDYLNLTQKPTLTEEQYKYFVQSNTLIEKGDYFEAIDLYYKALDINPISYIPAYYNLALISAMAESYPHAIFCMKKYLMLAPKAEDARDAQDKIYEWEVTIQIK